MASFASNSKRIRITQREPDGEDRHAAIVLLHGSGGNVDFWADRVAPYLKRLNIALYAVHYFDSTDTVRADEATIRDGYHFPVWLATLFDALAYVRSRPGVDPARIALFGVSLGAFLGLALGTDPELGIRAVVEISGGMPEPYAGGATAAFPPTLIVHGTADTIVPVGEAQSLDALLTRLGVPHETRLMAGQGHWFDAAAQMQILLHAAGFLSQHL